MYSINSVTIEDCKNFSENLFELAFLIAERAKALKAGHPSLLPLEAIYGCSIVTIAQAEAASGLLDPKYLLELSIESFRKLPSNDDNNLDADDYKEQDSNQHPAHRTLESDKEEITEEISQLNASDHQGLHIVEEEGDVYGKQESSEEDFINDTEKNSDNNPYEKLSEDEEG